MKKSNLLQLRDWNTCMKLRDQVVRIEKDTDRVLGKLRPEEPGVTFFWRIEVIDLQFDLIAIRVGIVH